MHRLSLAPCIGLIVLLSTSSVFAQDLFSANSRTETMGNVEVSLSWREGGSTMINLVSSHLKISRSGITVFDEDISDVGMMAGTLSDYRVIDLNYDQEPEILIPAGAGGQSEWTAIYYYDSASLQYKSFSTTVLNARDNIVDIDRDGRHEIIGWDDRFYNKDLCTACQRYPVRILQYVRGETFMNVTPRFPETVEANAKNLADVLMNTDDKNERAQAGVSWLADMHTLGRGSDAWEQLKLTPFYTGDDKKIEEGKRVLKLFGYLH